MCFSWLVSSLCLVKRVSRERRVSSQGWVVPYGGRVEESVLAAGSRPDRVANRVRNPKWKSPALRIDMSICINCDTCLRHCPPQFGAIFNHGIDVVIISELCSGCGKCLPPVCPVDCIVVDQTPDPTPDEWWDYPLGSDDPYLPSNR